MVRRIVLLLLAVTIAMAVFVFTATAVRAFLFAPDTEIEVPQANQSGHTAAQYPVRVRIPAIGVDASIQEVGINGTGNMAVPTNYTDTGWYKYGPVPGESGSAVIAGHVNNGLGLSGVFEHLGDLKAGDDIYIERADGETVHFVVTSSRVYPYTDAPAEVIFNPTGSVRLNLITCEGKWVKEDKTYDQRLVVFTKLASE